MKSAEVGGCLNKYTDFGKVGVLFIRNNARLYGIILNI